MLTFPIDRRKHNAAGSLQVLLVSKGVGLSFRSVGFSGDGPFHFFGEVVESIRHLAHAECFVVPGLNLLGVELHLSGEVVVYVAVFLVGVGCGALQAVAYEAETFEHVGGDIQCEHGQEEDIHQVDHLLTWGNRSFFDSAGHYNNVLMRSG